MIVHDDSIFITIAMLVIILFAFTKKLFEKLKEGHKMLKGLPKIVCLIVTQDNYHYRNTINTINSSLSR